MWSNEVSQAIWSLLLRELGKQREEGVKEKEEGVYRTVSCKLFANLQFFKPTLMLASFSIQQRTQAGESWVFLPAEAVATAFRRENLWLLHTLDGLCCKIE